MLRWIGVPSLCMWRSGASSCPESPGTRRGASSPRGLHDQLEPGGGLVEAFRQGLNALGWVEGRNLAIVFRWAESDLARHPRLIAELIAARVDVIVIAGSSAARAARQARTTVPFVTTALGDPVEQGLVASLARRAPISPGSPGSPATS